MLIFRGGSDAAQLSPEESQQQMQKWFEWYSNLAAKTAGNKIVKFIVLAGRHICFFCSTAGNRTRRGFWPACIQCDDRNTEREYNIQKNPFHIPMFKNLKSTEESLLPGI